MKRKGSHSPRTKGKNTTPSSVTDDFIDSLLGCCKGRDSLVAHRELEHKRDERALDQKRKVRGGKVSC